MRARTRDICLQLLRQFPSLSEKVAYAFVFGAGCPNIDRASAGSRPPTHASPSVSLLVYCPISKWH